MITQSRCKELFEYRPDTGELFWRVARTGGVKAGDRAGGFNNKGYIRIHIDGKGYLAHRIIWLMQTGSMPCDQTDHINHIKHDNRWTNLREATHQENQQNKSMFANNTSGVMGVYWHKATKQWKAQIKADDQKIFLGYFEDINNAIAARRAAEVKYGFHANHGLGD